MKIGKAEGTPEEITNLFQNNGLKLADYLEKTEAQLHWKWFLIPCILIAIALLLLVLGAKLPPKINILFFLVGASGVCCLSASLQIRFKNFTATIITAIILFLILLIAAGLLAPKETIDALKTLKNKD